jgi:hypothetical protein
LTYGLWVIVDGGGPALGSPCKNTKGPQTIFIFYFLCYLTIYDIR